MRTLLASTLAFLTTSACTDSPTMDETPEMTEPMPGAVGLAPMTTVRIVRNATVDVPVTITRDENAMSAAVTVALADLPTGVTAQPLVIPHGAMKGTLKVTAGADIALGNVVTATVRATTSDGHEATAPLDMRLTDKPGALDTSFAVAGMRSESLTKTNEYATTIVRQPDGKTLVAGVTADPSITYLARYLNDGTIDTMFGTDGSIKVAAATLWHPDIVLRSDGSILLVTRQYGMSTVRAYDAFGHPLMNYGNKGSGTELSAATIGVTFSHARAVAGPNDTVYVAGADGTNLIVLRLTSAGLPDPTFDGDGRVTIDCGGSETTWDLVIRSNGRPVVFGSAGAGLKTAIAQLLPDGSLDASFSGDGKAIIDGPPHTAYDFAALSDGRLAIIQAYPTWHIQFVEQSGTATQFVFPDQLSEQRGLAERDGDLYVVGTNLIGALITTKVSASGQLDLGFGTDGVSAIDQISGTESGYAAVMDDDGKLVIAGATLPDGALRQSMLARIWL